MKFTIVATFFLVVVQLQSVLGAPTSDIETSSSPPHPRPSKRLKTVSFTEKVLSSEACKTGDPVSLRQLQAEYAQLGETHQTNLEVTVDGIVSSFSVDSIFINCHPSITTWILFDLLQQDVFEGGYFQEWLQHVFNEAALRGNLKLMKAIYAEIPSNEERFELIKMEDQHPENEYVAFVEACQAGQLESAAQLHRWHLDLIQGE